MLQSEIKVFPSGAMREESDSTLYVCMFANEWENDAGEEFGIERLIDVVREARHKPPEEIIAQLYNSVKTFVHDTKQMDDLTAVVIKRVMNALWYNS